VKRSTKTKPRRKPRAATGQNWAQRMEAARLLHMADQILGIPPTYGAPRPDTALFNPSRDAPLPTLLLADIERWQLADYLRALANPRMLKAMQKARSVKRRGRKGDGAKVWRAALELELSKRPKDVPPAWGIGRSHLYEMHGQLSNRPGGYWEGSWRYWAAYELRRFRRMHRDVPPRARRTAFIEQLRAVR
jgi:hypothetical protein